MSAAVDKSVAELLSIYQATEKDLRRILGSADSTDFMRGRASRLLPQVDRVVRALKKKHRRWAQIALKDAYKAGAAAATGTEAVFDAVDLEAVRTIAQRVILDLDVAVDGIPRELANVLRRTQQEAVSDVALLRETGRAKVLGLTREDLAKRIAQTLRDGATERLRGQGLPADLVQRLRTIAKGQYIPIVGRDGKQRLYGLQTYAELVAHTWGMAASNEAALRSAERLGTDLVQVSVHSNVPDEPCRRVQGKVYSITGRTRQFPRLNFSLPIHPRCRHRFVPVNLDTLIERGMAGPLARFSNSDETVRDLQHFRETVRPATGVRQGRQYRGFRNTSVRSDEQLQEMLHRGIRLAGEEFLTREPLEHVTFADRLSDDARGWYIGAFRRVEILARRTADDYGETLRPHSRTQRGTWAMSKAAPTAEESILRTIVHELSHHMHLGLRTSRTELAAQQRQVDQAIDEAFFRSRNSGVAITEYATYNEREYWTESHTAYIFAREALRAHDPHALTMVRRVREFLGLPDLGS